MKNNSNYLPSTTLKQEPYFQAFPAKFLSKDFQILRTTPELRTSRSAQQTSHSNSKNVQVSSTENSFSLDLLPEPPCISVRELFARSNSPLSAKAVIRCESSQSSVADSEEDTATVIFQSKPQKKNLLTASSKDEDHSKLSVLELYANFEAISKEDFWKNSTLKVLDLYSLGESTINFCKFFDFLKKIIRFECRLTSI